MIVALTMTDAAERQGLKIDFAALQEALGGVPVYPVVATTGRGFAGAQGRAWRGCSTQHPPRCGAHWPELRAAARAVRRSVGARRIRPCTRSRSSGC